jgi:hypothetical protein
MKDAEYDGVNVDQQRHDPESHDPKDPPTRDLELVHHILVQL